MPATIAVPLGAAAPTPVGVGAAPIALDEALDEALGEALDEALVAEVAAGELLPLSSFGP
jgi:hypothetical protein